MGEEEGEVRGRERGDSATALVSSLSLPAQSGLVLEEVACVGDAARTGTHPRVGQGGPGRAAAVQRGRTEFIFDGWAVALTLSFFVAVSPCASPCRTPGPRPGAPQAT